MSQKGKRGRIPPWGKVPVRVVRDTDLTGNDRHVYEALTLYANKQGMCWPKRATLAELTGLPDRAIGRATTHLAERGHVLKIGNGGRGRPAKYLLIQDENQDTSDRLCDAKPGHLPTGFSSPKKVLNPDTSDRGIEQTIKGQGQGRLRQQDQGSENVILFPASRAAGGGV